MVPMNKSPIAIGSNLGRSRWQRGWVEETGRKAKKWKGHYYIYVLQLDGTEKRGHRSVILGLKSQMRKSEAEKKLQEIVDRAANTDEPPVYLSPDHTLRWFRDERYRPLKEPQWKISSLPKTIRFFNQYILPAFGDVPLDQIHRFAVQMHLNDMAKKYSYSVVSKFRVYVKAMLDEALEQDLISKNPARKLAIPETRKTEKPALSEQEIAALLAHLKGRDRLIIRMFIVLGLRAGELFALRRNDRVEPSQLYIDEAVSEELRGDERLVKPKTLSSTAYVWLPESIRVEIDKWIIRMEDKRPEAFLFATRNGTPLNMNNFLRRTIKPAAERARATALKDHPELPASFLAEVNHQVFRRTCATHMQDLGSVKDIQAHLRHSTPAMTINRYIQQIPASVRQAVESLDEKLKAVQGSPEHILNTFEHESEED
jgi:integrase